MSFFKFDKKNVQTNEFKMVAEGKYEAVIVNAEAGKTREGKDKVTVDFEIRSDVEQAHQGAKILYNVYTFEREIAVKIVSSLVDACNFPDGFNFDSPEMLARELFGKHLEITVKHEADYNDPTKKYPKAKYYNVSKVGAPAGQAPITISEDDIPF